MDRLNPREIGFIILSRGKRASSTWAARSLRDMQSRLAHIYFFLSLNVYIGHSRSVSTFSVTSPVVTQRFVFPGNIRVHWTGLLGKHSWRCDFFYFIFVKAILQSVNHEQWPWTVNTTTLGSASGCKSLTGKIYNWNSFGARTPNCNSVRPTKKTITTRNLAAERILLYLAKKKP